MPSRECPIPLIRRVAENKSSGEAEYRTSGRSASFRKRCDSVITPFSPLNNPQHSEGLHSIACRSISVRTCWVILTIIVGLGLQHASVVKTIIDSSLIVQQSSIADSAEFKARLTRLALP